MAALTLLGAQYEGSRRTTTANDPEVRIPSPLPLVCEIPAGRETAKDEDSKSPINPACALELADLEVRTRQDPPQRDAGGHYDHKPRADVEPIRRRVVAPRSGVHYFQRSGVCTNCGTRQSPTRAG
jgi:hypothetical protein